MMLESEEVWHQAAREILRSVRGSRSQVAFSRRLGYRSNVAADWEGGHRAPTAEELLRAMARVGIDVEAGFRAFHGGSAARLAEGLPAWLDHLRGHTPQHEVARRSGASRHQVRRWLTGEARPRVPAFLRLLHALTGRAPDWVASLLPIGQVPSLHAPWQRARDAARLAYDEPWSSAVRLLLATDAYRADPTDAFVADALGLHAEQLRPIVASLLGSGLVRRVRGSLRPGEAFTADAQASSDDTRRLKHHWASVAASRLDRPQPNDLVSLNLVALSRADLARVHDLQRAYFRELRALVAASEPEETAALVLMHVLELTPDGHTR